MYLLACGAAGKLDVLLRNNTLSLSRSHLTTEGKCHRSLPYLPSSRIHYFLNLKMDDLAQTRNILKRNQDLRWGFVIYRCTYESDSDWARFMDLLNTRVRVNLEEESSLDLFDRLDWCVQDDRDVLDGASTGQVRT
jgi:hypothetical protein